MSVRYASGAGQQGARLRHLIRLSHLFLWIILFMAGTPELMQAQQMKNGYLVVACRPAGANGATMAIKDMRTAGTLWQTASNRGKNQSSHVPVIKEYKPSDLQGSHIFSTTIDHGDGTIYAAGTSLYSLNSNAVARIFRIDPVSGAVSVLTTLPGNRGLSYIDLDAVHKQIFAANLDDGKIYRVDQATGNTLSVYDPMTADNGAAGLAPIGERILGVAYNAAENRVYYSVWANDMIRNGQTPFARLA